MKGVNNRPRPGTQPPVADIWKGIVHVNDIGTKLPQRDARVVASAGDDVECAANLKERVSAHKVGVLGNHYDLVPSVEKC